VVQREYRSISRRDYYRLARAERDTAGRPSCQTDNGRTVYGGGGIYPDIPLSEEPPQPRWAMQLEELQLPLTWSGGWASANAASLGSLDAFVVAGVPAAAIADFRAYAAKQGVTIPADGTERLQALLTARVAESRWGSEGAYRAMIRGDRAIREATAGFAKTSP
jgi:carboxyl-terminal processing protease